MNTPLQTSAVSIPSVALAMMALRLAWRRRYQDDDGRDVTWVPPRPELTSDTSACAEYYRVIDRISAGEAP